MSLKTSPPTTPEREAELVAIYQKTGCHDALEEILRGRAAWVWRAVNAMPLRQYTDLDACFSDAMSEIALSIHRFDASRKFSSFLSSIVTRSAFRSQKRQNIEQNQDFVFEKVIDESPRSASDILQSMREIIDAIPPEEINESTRIVIERLMSGCTVEEIASMMGWTVPRTRKAVEHVRCFIAYQMLMSGKSAAPWIDDRDLDAMARQYEMATKLSFGLLE